MGAVGCENPLVSLLYKFYFLLIKLREREEILYKSTYVHMCMCAFCISADTMPYMFVYVYASVCRNRMIWYTYSFLSFLARNLCLFSFIWNPNIIFYFKPFEDNMTSRRG